MRRITLSLALCIPVFAVGFSLYASPLLRVSDLISTSAPNATSTHTIQFVTINAVPQSGTITITPQSGAYTIPAQLDYTDVDFAVSSGGIGGPFVERTLAASASATEDGVTVNSGTSGSFVIRLNSTTGIGAGYAVRIRIGENASHGTQGDWGTRNSSSLGSHTERIETANASGGTIDYQTTFITLVSQVTVNLEPENVPPPRSNGLPTGTVAAGNPHIEISLQTEEPSTCRYATSTGVAYASMTGSMSGPTGYVHYTPINGHQNSTTYHYYVRCSDEENLPNPDDYEITFSLDDTPINDTSIVLVGSDGRGGVGPFAEGSWYLYLASVRLKGLTSPNSTVYILKDGVVSTSGRANSSGAFDLTVANLERGAYTFLTYATDSLNRKSSSYSSTLTLSQASSNTISDIIIPPTISLKDETIDPGESAEVSGESVPGSTIDLIMNTTGSADVKKFSTTVAKSVEGKKDGEWTIVIPASSLQNGSYELRAKTSTSTLSTSPYSSTVILGVGEVPAAGLFNRADLNRDGKVNLVDFSIMLSFWGSDDENADINEDGIVNLADFSIMLFNWTG